jgi:radical SAM protein with 4Fe4S-binding SPASM domain
MFLKLKKPNKEDKIIKGIKNGSKAFTGPGYLVIDITNSCNLNCIACWTFSPLLGDESPGLEWKRQQLPFEVIRKLIDDLDEIGTKEIRLTGGGEPFSHPNIMEIIELIKEKGMICDVTTNFTLVNKEIIRRLIDFGIDNITASIWAGTPETYVKTHPNQTEKTFYRIKENLKFLNEAKDEKTKVVIANVIFNLNYHEIEKMVDFGIETNSDEIYFTLIDPIENATDSLLLNKKQQGILLKKIQKIKDKNPKIRIDNIENLIRRILNEEVNKGRYDSNIINKIPCYAGWLFARILANGDVSPCCRAVKFPTGNINKESFKRIWNGEKQKEFRRNGLKMSKEFISKIGCDKMCDNLMQNIEMHNKIKIFDQKG